MKLAESGLLPSPTVFCCPALDFLPLEEESKGTESRGNERKTRPFKTRAGEQAERAV